MDPINTKKHLPPRIVIEKIPTELVVPYLTLTRATRDIGCSCELALSVPLVAEDDPTAALEGRWFVNYDLRIPSSLKRVSTSPMPGVFDFNAVERTGPSYTVNADDLADGFHTIEVVVAESDGFVPDNDPNAKLPQRTLLSDYSASTYRFFVKVVTDPDLVRCPEQPPATRFCSGGR